MLLTWGSSQGLNALMNSAEFIAGFADAGSGAVDLTLSKGTGSATFTRATTATTVNSAGLIVSVASGTPRSYYDPTTLAYLGYLSEGARTNLCLQSEDLATTWTVGGVTIGTNQIAAPDGATTADKLLEDTSTGVHRIIQSITVLNTTVYTVSLFVKAAERTFAGLFFSDGVTTFAKQFNLSTQAMANITSTTAPTSSEIKSYPSGWYRISITFTTTGTAGSFQLRMGNASDTYSYTGTLNSGMYAWGAQLEAGSFASTYIPTTTASVTRNADVLTYPSSGNVSGTAGSCYAELTFPQAAPAGFSPRIIDTGDAGLSIPLFLEANTGKISLFDGTSNRVGTAPTFPLTSPAKIASAWGGSTTTLARAGTTTDGGGFDGNMNIATTIGIGNRSSGGAAGNEIFGTVKNIRIFQTQLTASQLQAVTS